MRHTRRTLAAVLTMALGAGCTSPDVQHDVHEQYGEGAGGDRPARSESFGESLDDEGADDGPSGFQTDLVPATAARSEGGGDFGTSSTAASITTDKSSYAYGETVAITFANLPGNRHDWIGLAPQGSDATEVAWFQYTLAATSGTYSPKSADRMPSGSFVARAFSDDSYTLLAESAAFTVGSMGSLPATVSVSKSSFTGLELVGISFGGLAGTSTDWVGAYRPWASMLNLTTWGYTAAPTGSGSSLLTDLYAGTWELRAFENDDYLIKGRSSTFTVTSAVATNKTSYVVGEDVVVSFGGTSGHVMDDELQLFNRRGLLTSLLFEDVLVATAKTAWDARGTRTFPTASLSKGKYVVKLCFKLTNTCPATSAELTVN